jgi:hypothetical protein
MTVLDFQRFDDFNDLNLSGQIHGSESLARQISHSSGEAALYKIARAILFFHPLPFDHA